MISSDANSQGPPGTLTWLPAASHPELLAPPVASAIDQTDVTGTDLYVAEINPGLADTAAFCRAYDVGLEVSANCVVVEGRRGDKSTLAAIMVLATDRADVNKAIRRHLGSRKASFAPMETAISRTKMDYGGITPIGVPTGWPILVDDHVAETAWLIIGSGIRGSKIAIRGADLAALPGAETLALTV